MEQSNKKVVRIIGGGFENKGAEAMLMVTVEAVRRCIKGADIVVRLRTRNSICPPDNESMRFEKEPSRALIPCILSYLSSSIVRHQAGVVIDIGGYQFVQGGSESYAKNKGRQVRQWIKSGNYVFFLPQAWGPFSSIRTGKAISAIINDSTLSFARDKKSLEELWKLVGENHPKVRLAHDIAWNFKGDSPSVGHRLISEAGLSLKSNMLTVCVTPNTQVYKRAKGSGLKNEYISLLCDIIRHLCHHHNAQIILLGHAFLRDNSVKQDDRTLCNYILSDLDRSFPVVHIDKVLTAAQVKSVIGICDLSLSSRYHALIAALSQEIPAATLGWSHKYDELLNDIGLSSNIISASMDRDTILNNIDMMITNLAQTRETLKSKLPAIKQSGQRALDEVISAIAEKFRR